MLIIPGNSFQNVFITIQFTIKVGTTCDIPRETAETVGSNFSSHNFALLRTCGPVFLHSTENMRQNEDLGVSLRILVGIRVCAKNHKSYSSPLQNFENRLQKFESAFWERSVCPSGR